MALDHHVKIETSVWRRDPDRPGNLAHVRQRTVREVYDDLRAVVGECPHGGEDSFSPYVSRRGRDWPKGRIVVFVVGGANEGDYVHVEVHCDPDGHRELVMLAKTFDGRDAAWAFARRLADLLEE
jgi:hypothetical protein